MKKKAVVRCTRPLLTVLKPYLSNKVELNSFAHQIQQIVQQYTSSQYDLRVLVGFYLLWFLFLF
jgi:hypothetical protein